jgi:hypothetical protein
MTRLVLTADDPGAASIVSAGLADLAVAIELRTVWGPPRSNAELTAFLARRTSQPPEAHWLDSTPPWRLEKFGMNDLGLSEACRRCETIELWMGTEPNAQLVLIWLLDHLSARAKELGITLRHIDAALGETEPARLAKVKFAGVAIDDPIWRSRAWRGRPSGRRRHTRGSIFWQKISASCRSFDDAFWKCSKNCRGAQPGSAHRNCGCSN